MSGSKIFSFILISVITILVISDFSSYGERSSQSVRSSGIVESHSMFQSLSAGKQLYDEYCDACHGFKGNGEGEYANEMKIKPTDFTSGMYKFKSTPFGTLPTVGDIVSTLELGVRTTAMIPQLQLSSEQMREVANYLLSFAPKDDITGKPIAIPSQPRITAAFIIKGKNLFDFNCAGCHGKDAKGDGPSGGTLFNYKGKPIKPANLTVLPLKRANTPEWTYRIINNGIEGTPMPAYFGTMKPENIWAIVDYINSLKKENLAGRSYGGMMGGMMGSNLIGEESIGIRIDMAAAHAWMMRGMMDR